MQGDGVRFRGLARLTGGTMKHSCFAGWVTALLLVLMTASSCLPVAVPTAPVTSDSLQLVELEASPPSSARLQTLQALFAAAEVDQAIYLRHDTISVRWPDDLDASGPLAIRVQTAAGRIYRERLFEAKASTVANLGKAYTYPEGDYFIVLMATPGEYHVGGLRVVRQIAIRMQTATP
jgi:hypothetical protein